MKTSTITLIIAQLVAIVSAQTGKLVPLHQYNFGQKGKGELVSSDQFYTTNFDEMNRCKGKDGYRYEGIAAYVYECSVRDTVPLYRFVLDTKKYKDHFYTTDEAEVKNDGQMQGFKSQGKDGCVLENKKQGAVPLYRYLLNTKKHRDTFLTVDLNLVGPEGKEKFGYKYDGIVGYVTKINPKDKFMMCDPFYPSFRGST